MQVGFRGEVEVYTSNFDKKTLPSIKHTENSYRCEHSHPDHAYCIKHLNELFSMKGEKVEEMFERVNSCLEQIKKARRDHEEKKDPIQLGLRDAVERDTLILHLLQSAVVTMKAKNLEPIKDKPKKNPFATKFYYDPKE